MDLRTFLGELRRRKVYRASAVYVAVGLGILGAAELILDPLGLAAARPFIVIMIVLGFPICIVLAWAYELGPDPGGLTETGSDSSPVGQDDGSDNGRDHSIVVLPFDNLSPDPGDSYFSDGLTDEVTSHLSFLQALRVVSRNTASILKKKDIDARTIGEELGVRFVLEGSVRKSGEQIRINVQLVDALVDENVWTDSYNGTMEDVFALQERVSQSIVDALGLRLSVGEWRHLSGSIAGDFREHEMYQRARRDYFDMTPGGLNRALKDLELGIKTFGESELLLQGVAAVHLQRYEMGVATSEETLETAESYADRLEEFPGGLLGSNYIRGRIARFRGDQKQAYNLFRDVLDADPNHVEALTFGIESGGVHCGRPDLVRRWAERLDVIDPLSGIPVLVLANYHWSAERYEESLKAYEKLLEIEPEASWTLIMMSFVHAQMKNERITRELAERLAKRGEPQYAVDFANLVLCGLNKDAEGARSALTKSTEDYFWRDPEAQYLIASLFACAGATDEALRWTQRCVDQGWINYPLFATQDRNFESIRSNQRFRRLLEQIKTDWEKFPD